MASTRETRQQLPWQAQARRGLKTDMLFLPLVALLLTVAKNTIEISDGQSSRRQMRV